MTRKDIKKFLKDHGGKIAAGGLCIVSYVIGYYVGKPRFTKEVAEFGKSVARAMKGSSVYTEITGNEAAEAFKNFCIADPDGVVCQVTGAVVFGNKVEPKG